jgi:hypothetical protein
MSEPLKVELMRPKIWHETDISGTTHIKVQHGQEPFDYIQIQYRYPYTDNAGNKALADSIVAMLGAAAEIGRGMP